MICVRTCIYIYIYILERSREATFQSACSRQRRGRNIEKLSVGAFVGSQSRQPARCWAPRASVGSQSEAASALLGAQGKRWQPDRASQRVAARPGRALEARSGQPARCWAPRASVGSQIEPASALLGAKGERWQRFVDRAMLFGAYQGGFVDRAMFFELARLQGR